MNSPIESASTYLENRALVLLLFGVSVAFVWILLPFYGAIMWGSVIALLFVPLYQRLLRRFKQKRTLAALVTLLIVLVIVILPLTLITASLAREAAALYQRMESGELNPATFFKSMFNVLPQWVTGLLDRVGLADFEALQRRLATALTQGSQFIATQALNIGQNTFEFVVGFFITLYLAFFLMRDGEELGRIVRRALPLPRQHQHELFEKFATVIRATVKGNLLVAAAQGALGGIAFWFLGVNGALLWAVLMAFLSLLPAVGAGLVWAPVAIYFLVTGDIWRGAGLVAYGVLVIGLVDNLLRPVLVGRDTRMPDFVVLLATVGGMAVFGINGFVLGPAIAAMFIAVWHIYASARTPGSNERKYEGDYEGKSADGT